MVSSATVTQLYRTADPEANMPSETNDVDLTTNGIDASKKKMRRRRSMKRPKPCDEEEDDVPELRRSTRLSAQGAMAPYNSNHFLIEDLYERTVTDQNGHGSETSQSSEKGANGLDGSNCSTAGQDDIDCDEEDFEQALQDMDAEKATGMNRDELTRELVNASKDNRKIVDELERVKDENGRLKNILKKYGLPEDGQDKAS
ncbi:unnamed protein product, partial [Mesorhabditis spiculigera]